MRGVNLIPPHRRQAARRAACQRRWVLAVTAYATALGVVYAVTLLTLSGGVGVTAEQLAEREHELTQVKQEHQRLLPQLSELQKTLAAAQAVSDQPDWSLLLQALAEALGDSAMLQEVELTPVEDKAAVQIVAGGKGMAKTAANASRYVLRLQGVGQTQEGVAAFVLALERLQIFESVRLVQTARQSCGPGAAIGCSVECVMSGAAEGT